ncbi:hypothetical protein CPAR01_13948 [Colletotrichum paranaense]|uniref:Uncharacterized protein n=1 Tax=Colletotrichum paranaense TaxID=1914294 RepID=A0ABQ9S358_9PEZI|nr:uncharacterized protein CPAR01_13948 [Colletotrichum paranaense]KAK1523095.1 hypothetical protein CPAR01_13948 [Colletotrichum paranaense]
MASGTRRLLIPFWSLMFVCLPSLARTLSCSVSRCFAHMHCRSTRRTACTPRGGPTEKATLDACQSRRSTPRRPYGPDSHKRLAAVAFGGLMGLFGWVVFPVRRNRAGIDVMGGGTNRIFSSIALFTAP